MPLAEPDIVVGAIAYFDAQLLNGDAVVEKHGDRVTRVGPTSQFVCYKVDGDKCYWAPLTGSYNDKRLPIDPGWLANASGKLAAGEVLLQDGKNAYVGPKASFVLASANEFLFGGARPHVDAVGIAAIQGEILNRHGPL